MKEKTIKLHDGRELLVVKIRSPHWCKHSGYLILGQSKLDVLGKCKNIDSGDIRGFIFIGGAIELGRLPDISEDQAKMLVEKESKPTYSHELDYPEYVCDEWWYRDYSDEDYVFLHLTAIESLQSLLEANGVLFENPLGNEKDYKKRYDGHDMFFADYMEKWQTAQEQVFDIERTYLFLKVKQ